jgi:alkanesulfonate monooxygenase SsuD/methylene tetrahydromethanopterin reductase-like flavin-dependent oxidoreductase (luciferase family)
LGAAVAARTRNIRIGTAVTVLPLHHPLIVAEDFAMLDVVSGGRLDFGVGRGSALHEFELFGIPPEESAEALTEAAELIARAWREEQFEHRGKRFRFKAMTVLPRPIQRPHPPIWAGVSRTPESFAWAGRNGFHLMVLPYLMSPEAMRERLAIYLDALRTAGHDPTTRQIMSKFHVFVANTSEEARTVPADSYDHYQRIASGRGTNVDYHRRGTTWAEHVDEFKVIAGTPADCVERIRYWRDALGLTHLAGTFHFGGLAQEATLRSIELFASKVAPQI